MATTTLERPTTVNGRGLGVTSNGEVTNAELARRLDTFSRDVHTDLAEMSRKLDAYVLREVYQSDQRRREDQINALAKQLDDERRLREADRQAVRTAVDAERGDRKKDQQQLRNTVRWLISALILPVGVLLVQIWLSTRGGG